MRVLLLHNRYRSQGGEERAVANIVELLSRRGDQVELLERSSAQAGSVRAAGSMLAGGIDPGAVARAVRRLGADVVHVHNIHPLFGWRALAAARAAGARTVLHVHNFRLFCAIGVAYRDGAVCHRCAGRNTLPGLRLRCRGPLLESAVYAAAISQQQPRLFGESDRLVGLSEAHVARLRELGLPADKTCVLPNFVPSHQFAPGSSAAQGRYALIAGRLVEEKGYDTAILAARAASVPLIIVGAGPDERRLRRLALGGAIRFTGWVTQDELTKLRREAAVELAPLRCEEACPYTVLDALAAGIPVLASNLGGLPELVGDHSALDPADSDGWASALRELWENPARREQVGGEGLERARVRFGEDRYYEGLMRIYRG
jgi:glycosyltransferase involved in cell wall biosynthesis